MSGNTTISGNSATGETWSEGGGLRVQNGSAFIMEGGTITGNTATSGGFSVGVCIANEGSTFTMQGGTISDNTVAERGDDDIVDLDPDGFGGTDDTLIAVPRL
jgi:hypothetical protein